MLFVSDIFLLFFLVVYVVFWSLPVSYRTSFLILASLVFYGSWNILFTIHFAGVICINYYVMQIWRVYRRKWIFVLLQIGNVANIAVFKYYYFLADILGVIFRIPAWRHPGLILADRAQDLEILLPLAISFYTFQIMAYGFDIYRGTYTRSHRLRDVILFISFFPQLIAGPIMRSSELLGQLADYGTTGMELPSANRMKKGLWLVLIGVVKKVLIADRLLLIIAPVFSSPAAAVDGYSAPSLWLALYCSILFLYADFSAYSDLARGFGLLLGFEIPINFQAPLFSHSISDFWRRWHLTFSRWIRDYIYIPLGGSRVSEKRVYFNWIFTFFLAGLWHGASYTFVVWGLWMGVFLSLERFLRRRGIEDLPRLIPWRILRIAIAWVILVLSAALFFAPTPLKLGSADSFVSLKWSFHLMGRLFDISAWSGGEAFTPIGGPETVVASLLALFIFNWFEEKPRLFSRFRKYENFLLPLVGMVVILAMVEFAGVSKDFFYFQF